MSGFIYCFNCVGDATTYKVGFTKQSTLQHRFRGYLGPSKPRMLVASKRVDDAERAETLAISLFKQNKHLVHDDTLGEEWFRSTEGDAAERHRSIQLVFDVVQMATTTSIVTPVKSVAPARPISPTNNMPCEYFEALQTFVAQAPRQHVQDAEHCLASFEQSDACPLLMEFTPFSKAVRIAAVKKVLVPSLTTEP